MNAKQANTWLHRRSSREVRQHWPLLLILPIFVALGVLYSVVTPIFEVLDEPMHFRYAKRLADGEGLPTSTPTQDSWEQAQAHQPPLYYAVGALLIAPIDTGPSDTLYEPNPFSASGMPHAPSNKNAVLHRPDEQFPYRGVSLAVHLLRWFSVLCSAGTVVFAYLSALQIAPRRRDIATGTAALTAFNPQFLFLSGGASSDALFILLNTIALYLALKIANGWDRPRRSPLLLGLVVGLAALTKLSGLAAIALIIGAYVLRVRQTESPRLSKENVLAVVHPIALALGAVVLVAGWWYVRNIVLYRDPLGMSVWMDRLVTPATASSLGEAIRRVAESVVSYWGVFGWMNVLADEIFYTWARVLTLVGIVGMALLAARTYWQRKTFRDQRWRALGLLALWILVTATWLIGWTLIIAGPQGRLLFPAIAAISFVLFTGLTGWMLRRMGTVLSWLMAGVFVVISVLVPFRYIAPTYAQPQRIQLDQVPADLQPLDIYFGDKLFLLGYEIPDDNVKPGEALGLRLYWLALKRMRNDYTFSVQVFGRDDARIGGLDTYPGGGNYPTSLWIPGEVVVETYAVPIDADAQAPTAGTVRVGIYDSLSQVNLVTMDVQARELAFHPQIAQVRVSPPGQIIYQPREQVSLNLGDNVLLTGYDLPTESLSPGDNLVVTLYWKPISWMPNDYTVFLHLLDEDGNIEEQVDEQPVAGNYPTHLWVAEETVQDTHSLRLPSYLPEGNYYLHIGLYWLETGERLPLVGSDPPTDYVRIGPVYVGD
ncbi:MAG: DUF2142 domain-containing protein [Chloroflexi bacterium]|nr:DUF2142 domain-containing protein [Chloroflexota bacterium]